MNRLKRKVWLKITAGVLFVISLSALCWSVAAGLVMYELSFYSGGPEKARYEVAEKLAWNRTYEIAYDLYESKVQGFDELYKTVEKKYAAGNTNLYFDIVGIGGELLYSNFPDADYGEQILITETNGFDSTESYRKPDFEVLYENCGSYYINGLNSNDDSEYHPNNEVEIYFYVDAALTADDSFRQAAELVDSAYALRRLPFTVAALSSVLFILAFVFLMSAAGYHTQCEKAYAGGLHRVPFELLIALLAAVVALTALGICVVDEVFNFYGFWICICLMVPVWATLLLVLFMSFAVRIKTSTLIKNTLIYRLFRVLKKYTGKLLRMAKIGASKLPLIPKTVAVLAVWSGAEIVVMLFCISSYFWEALLLLWFLEKLILSAGIIYIALVLKKLKDGGKRIAEGDVNYTVDSKYMLGEFKEHADDLNSINQGVQKAVEKQMKSERLKTELITNVSHDIKTPITSVVSYVDLLKKEPAGSENAAQYIEVLERQAGRLKRLTEDLIEASKAATGNVKVSKERTDMGLLLSQSAGEYEDRICASGLHVVLDVPEAPVYAEADGRLVWRVFDNLLSNICKYSMQGTRVYLSAKAENGNVVISFKNISAEPINVAADELLERFVRGDQSRNTQGSGLGLSIARSLTEANGGTLSLVCDGDLFKAVLAFPESK